MLEVDVTLTEAWDGDAVVNKIDIEQRKQKIGEAKGEQWKTGGHRRRKGTTAARAKNSEDWRRTVENRNGRRNRKDQYTLKNFGFTNLPTK